jgi:hypothetical protein
MKCKEELKELVNLNLKICEKHSNCKYCPLHYYGNRNKDLCSILNEISIDLQYGNDYLNGKDYLKGKDYLNGKDNV